MRFLRVLLGSLLWLVAGVVGLLGVVLCVTVILLPVGIPLLMLARRLFRMAMALILPRAAVHPVQELGKKAPDVVSSGRSGRKSRKKLRKKATKGPGAAVDKAGKAVKKQRKKVPV
jgi:hypothetical protein